ncbi:hypothetical protein PO909_021746 [Leuciscus waleckii]
MEVNGNTSSAEEDEDEEVCRNGRRRNQLVPHYLKQDALETLTIKSGKCNAIDISNGYLC